MHENNILSLSNISPLLIPNNISRETLEVSCLSNLKKEKTTTHGQKLTSSYTDLNHYAITFWNNRALSSHFTIHSRQTCSFIAL